MSWIVLVLISNVAFAFGNLTSKLLMKNKDSDPIAFSFVSQLIVAVITAIVAAFTTTIDFSPLLKYLPEVAIMALVYALFNLFLYNAFKNTEASIVTILLASRSIWTILSAMLILGETVTVAIVGGALLIIGGIVVMFYQNDKNKNFEVSRGMIYALLAAFCIGTGFTIDAYLLSETGMKPEVYSIVSFGLPAFAVLAFRPRSIKNVSVLARPDMLRNVLLNGICYSISIIAIYNAFTSGGNASQIGPLAQTTVLFSVLFAYIFLNERDHPWKKLIGSLLVISGAVLLVL